MKAWRVVATVKKEVDLGVVVAKDKAAAIQEAAKRANNTPDAFRYRLEKTDVPPDPSTLPMRTWHANGSVVGGKYLGEVQARTEEEAIELAGRHAGVSFCHACTSECENAEIEEITVEPEE